MAERKKESSLGEEMFDCCIKTERLLLKSFKIQWTIENFSTLSTGTITSPEFNPLPSSSCHLDFEILADDLRVYLCYQNEEHFVDYDFVITDCTGLALYKNTASFHNKQRYDLTDISMRENFPLLETALNNKLILRLFLKIYGDISTTLCSNEHENLTQVDNFKKLSEDFKCYFINSLNTDVVFDTKEGSVAVHKGILSARSSVFAKMFEHGMSEAKKNVVQIEDMSLAVLQKFMLFLYSGEFCFDDDVDTLCSLYYASDKYNMLDLRRMCGESLLTKLKVDNVCQILSLAERHEDPYLKKKVITFINQHLKDVIESDGWNIFMDCKLSAEVIKMSLS